MAFAQGVRVKSPTDLEDEKGTCEVLGVSKEYLPLLQMINPGGSQMIMIRNMIHSGKIPNVEFMRWCTANDVIDSSRLINILQHMSHLKLMRYAEEQFGKYRRRYWSD